MAALVTVREVLDPRRYGAFAFQVWSHKVLRWAVPWSLAGLLATSLMVAGKGTIYGVALGTQIVFYGLAGLGWCVNSARQTSIARIPYYFVQVNLAMAAALIDLIRGRRVVLWEPSKR